MLRCSQLLLRLDLVGTIRHQVGADAVRFGWPVPGPVVRTWDPPATRYAAGHRGVDLAVVPGERVIPVDEQLRESAVLLARRILEGDSASWWFDRQSDWWVRGGKS